MDSDDVDDISDTEEALQVVDIIENTYFDFISQGDWPHLNSTFQLNSLGDATKPNFLLLPDSVKDIDVFKYEVTDNEEVNRNFSDITWEEPREFLDRMLLRNSSDPNVTTVITDGGTPLFVLNDESPTFWTAFDDENIVTDSYDSTVETTLNGSKTIVFGAKIPVFSKTNSFIPDLPSKNFPLLLAESSQASHLLLKQTNNLVDQKRALRGMNAIRSQAWRTHETKKIPDFGRR